MIGTETMIARQRRAWIDSLLIGTCSVTCFWSLLNDINSVDLMLFHLLPPRVTMRKRTGDVVPTVATRISTRTKSAVSYTAEDARQLSP